MIKCKQCERISNCPFGIQDCESIISTCDEFSFDLAEHDSELLDKAAEKLKERLWYTETEEGWDGYTVSDKDIDEVIEEMKAELQKGAE